MSDTASEPRGIGLGYIIYQQILAIIGAFALVAFLGHFISFDWRGAVADLVGVWTDYVRPTVKWVMDATIVALVRRAFGWNVEIPPVATDYFGVGAVTWLAAIRSKDFLYRQVLGGTYSTRPSFQFRNILLTALTRFALDVPFWPFTTSMRIRKLYNMVNYPPAEDALPRKYHHMFQNEAILSLAPIFYVALLLAANYLLLKPGT